MRVDRSYIDEDGRVYYSRAGRYNEMTKAACGKFKAGTASAIEQKNLAPTGDESAAAITLRNVKKELGL